MQKMQVKGHEPTSSNVQHEPYQRAILISIRKQTTVCIVFGVILTSSILPIIAVLYSLSMAAVLLIIRRDYLNFLSLGPGGPPYNYRGYIEILWFRVWALRDQFQLCSADATCSPNCGILTREPLPSRTGPRPQIAGIAPQRQLDQRCLIYSGALREVMEKLSSENPRMVCSGRSKLERHGLALFSLNNYLHEYHGEVAHIHETDGSMHVHLNPGDVNEVITKGWGQRHPLAMKHKFLRMPVAENFILIYAPRGRAHLQYC